MVGDRVDSISVHVHCVRAKTLIHCNRLARDKYLFIFSRLTHNIILWSGDRVGRTHIRRIKIKPIICGAYNLTVMCKNGRGAVLASSLMSL